MRAFTPSSPIQDRDLFSGRREQWQQLLGTLSQAGQHALLFGERGVGKTSLANVLAKESSAQQSFLALRVNADAKDTFSTVWHKVSREVTFVAQKQGLGFGAKPKVVRDGVSLPDDVSPDDVRKLLTQLGSGGLCLVVIDEFDRIRKAHTAAFADLIKTLSDHNVPATLFLVGVADSVDALMKEHASVERALVQVRMPRMSESEVYSILVHGLQRAEMTGEKEALALAVRFAQGLPHYAHLLGQNAGLCAANDGREVVSVDDVYRAVEKAVEKAQESIKNAHYEATVSPKKNSLYAQVLLACALAQPDGRGFFPAADVREPLSKIMGRRYEIPAFSQHLNDFCDRKRGAILEKSGTPRRYRFRFTNPLMQPYIIMKGLASGTIARGTLDEILGGEIAIVEALSQGD